MNLIIESILSMVIRTIDSIRPGIGNGKPRSLSQKKQSALSLLTPSIIIIINTS